MIPKTPSIMTAHSRLLTRCVGERNEACGKRIRSPRRFRAVLCFSSIVCAVHQELRCPDLVLVSIFDVHVAIELNRMLICRVVNSGDGSFVDQLAVVVIIIVCGQEYRFPFCVASSNMTDDTRKNFHCMRSPDVAPFQTMYVKGCQYFWDAEQGRH
ncbi:hypothetical protein GJ744_001062 [Endocarpon pusillum]|uniref:Uncharacterized protein n=1 Tax=Endocarpon pusillum TaxID=364733 RepID=A0A8H7A9V9_9EURO|nr:hypothetical protein GJ744_001062 [Endocarpon pusillum]